MPRSTDPNCFDGWCRGVGETEDVLIRGDAAARGRTADGARHAASRPTDGPNVARPQPRTEGGLMTALILLGLSLVDIFWWLWK